jgi:uncharacterized SAM-binding protein YcdF (DUF218 family)
MYYSISKFLEIFLEPAPLLTFLSLAGIALWLIRRRRLAKGAWACAGALILLFGIVPLGTWLALPLEQRFPAEPVLPDRVAGIIVLAGTERVEASAAWRQPLLSDPSPLIALAALGRRYPDARLVFSGGARAHDDKAVTEASIVRDFYARLGIDAGRILFEDRSRNTVESGAMVRALVSPQAGETWLLVTEALSLPRAVGVFRRAGFAIAAVPAGYFTGSRHPDFFAFDLGGEMRLANLAIHEWVGLVAYRLLGYTGEIYPR